jgi:hypothetical protein
MPPRKLDEPERANPLTFLRRLMDVSSHLTPDLRETLIALLAHKTSFLDKGEAEAGRITFTSNATQGQLAQLCHIGVRGVAKRLTRLQAAGVVSWEYTPKHAKGNDYTVVLSRTTLTGDAAAYGDPMTSEKSALPSDEVRTPGDSSQNSTGVKSVLSRATSGFTGSTSGNYPGFTSEQPRQEEQGSKAQGSETQQQRPWEKD